MSSLKRLKVIYDFRLSHLSKPPANWQERDLETYKSKTTEVGGISSLSLELVYMA